MLRRAEPLHSSLIVHDKDCGVRMPDAVLRATHTGHHACHHEDKVHSTLLPLLDSNWHSHTSSNNSQQCNLPDSIAAMGLLYNMLYRCEIHKGQ